MTKTLNKDVLQIIYAYKEAFEVFESKMEKKYIENAFLNHFFDNENIIITQGRNQDDYHIQYYEMNTVYNIIMNGIRYEKYKMLFNLKYYFREQKVLKDKLNRIRQIG